MSELPQNWVASPIGDLISLNPKIECPDELPAGFVPMQMVGKEYSSPVRFEMRPWGEIKKGYTHFANGDVLLAKITPCFENGKAGLVRGLPNGVGAGSTEYFVSRPHLDVLDAGYLYAFFKTDKFLKVGEVKMTGSVGHKRVPKDYLLETELPLAPLPEQKRIADKLDSVLARVDACRNRLDRIPVILKRFRQSVLAAATTGKLTDDWRNQLGESMCSVKVTDPYSHTVVAPASWRKTSFGEICDLIGGSQPPKSTFISDESDDVIRLIQIRDYKSDKFKVFIPRKLARRFCNKTDVMIGRYGPPIFQILRGLEGAYNVALMKAEPKIEELELDYLYYWLKGETLLRYVESGSERTAGQDGIRKELINVYPFFLPPKDEQTEIVRRVESLFAYADRLEARYAAARAQVEKLIPATLAKAFRGELVPQDPNDEPASALLERIRATKNVNPDTRDRAKSIRSTHQLTAKHQ